MEPFKVLKIGSKYSKKIFLIYESTYIIIGKRGYSTAKTLIQHFVDLEKEEDGFHFDDFLW